MQRRFIMRVLVIGATGMLGQALVAEAKRRKHEVFCLARKNAALIADITRPSEIEKAIQSVRPEIVLNAAALTDLNLCETEPQTAIAINTSAVKSLAAICASQDIPLVHISTDQYYTGHKNKKHSEKEPVMIVNRYAQTKYDAEPFVLAYAKGTVVRTNIVGFRGDPARPTFVEWALQELKIGNPMQLFNDFYTSSIDVYRFSELLFELLLTHYYGLINMASSEVASKEQFIRKLAQVFKLPLKNEKVVSVATLPVKRAESLGLDCALAERLLKLKMPTLEEVVQRLKKEYDLK